MKVVQKIFAFLLLTIISLSSAGISFYLHHCGCRQTTLISFETGYSQPEALCCCSEEPAEKENDNQCNLGSEKCCDESYYFLLLPVVNEKLTHQSTVSGSKIIAEITNEHSNLTDHPCIPDHGHSPPSPPASRAGKALVYFISQIRIPFPIS